MLRPCLKIFFLKKRELSDEKCLEIDGLSWVQWHSQAWERSPVLFPAWGQAIQGTVWHTCLHMAADLEHRAC